MKVPKIDFIKEKAAIVKNNADSALDRGKNFAVKAKRDFDMKRFKPIFLPELIDESFTCPKLINIVDWDKRLKEDVCEGAVAFNDGAQGMAAITVLTKEVDRLGVTFYPHLEEGTFYIDPCNPNLYINLNDYFDYQKKARVHELNEIAQDLGAKHIKITLKEEKKRFISHDGKGKVKGGIKGAKVGVEAKANKKSTDYRSIEVASELNFQGHEPQTPVLNYFKNEQEIESLINMRMDIGNPLHDLELMLSYTNSAGIKESDAIKIEAVIKKLKIGGNASITKEVEDEKRLWFNYQIEFPKE